MAAEEPLLAPAKRKGTAPLPAPSLHTLAVCSVAMIFVQTVFGGYSVFTSKAFKSSPTLSPLVFAFLRDSTASVVLLIAAWFQDRRKPVHLRRFWPSREDLGQFLGCGLLGVWGSQGLSAEAIKYLDPVLVSLLEPCMPMVTLVVSTLAGQEVIRLTRSTSLLKVGGAVIAVVGAVLIPAISQTEQKQQGSGAKSTNMVADSPNFGLGIFFLSLQLCMGGSYPVLQKTLLVPRERKTSLQQPGAEDLRSSPDCAVCNAPPAPVYDPLMVAAWGYALGTLILLLSIITSASDDASWQIDGTVIAAAAYASLLASSVNYYLMCWTNARATPLVITIFFPLQGVSAALLQWAVEGQTPSAAVWIGSAIIGCGVVASVMGKHWEGEELRKEALADGGERTELEKGGASAAALEDCAAGSALQLPDAGSGRGGFHAPGCQARAVV